MEMNQVSKQFSEKIISISFFFSIFVMYIHANNLSNVGLANNKSSIDFIVSRLIGGAIGGIAVPFFFMMSGYWFFRIDLENKTVLSKIFEKQKKRINTLLIPYFLWNTLGLVFYMCITRIPVISAMMNSGDTIDFTLKNIFAGIVLHRYNYPFWYLKDLIILTIISPILLILLKNKKIVVLFLLLAGCLNMADVSLYIIDSTSLLFFVFGAYMGGHAREWFEKRKTRKWIIIADILISIRIIAYLFNMDELIKITYLYSPLCICIAFDAFTTYRITWFKKQSFFIYAAHVIPVTITMKILARMSWNDISATIGYILTPWIVLPILFIIAKLLYCCVPKFYRVICGGR